MRAIKERTTCHQDLVTARELEYRTWPEPDECIRKFQYRGFLLSRFAAQLTLAHNLTNLGAGLLPDLQERAISKPVSNALHHRVGACSELAHLLWLEHPDFWLVTTGTQAKHVKLPYGPAHSMNHLFVMCNVGAGQLFKGQQVDTLSKLSGALIIDPFFNLVCQATELATEGAPLIHYWLAHNQLFVHEAQPHVDFASRKKLILAEAAQIAEAGARMGFLAKQTWPDQQKKMSDGLARYIKPQLDRALAELAPGTSWALTVTDDFNYELTSRDRLTDTVKALGEQSIPYTLVEGGKAIALRNPNPDELLAKTVSYVVEQLTKLTPANVRLILEFSA
jgi:hypothetical protein